MNNSQIAHDPRATEDTTPQVDTTERKSFLIRMIEAIGKISESREWNVLKKEIFDGVVETLERRLIAETKKPKIDEPEIYRLQGQLGWARKYSKIEDLQKVFKVELENLTKRTNANS